MPNAQAYAKMRETFLKQSKPEMYRAMKADGSLKEHLTSTGQQAMEMYEAIEAQMMAQSPPEEPYPERVKRFEQIPVIAEEIVTRDLVLAL